MMYTCSVYLALCTGFDLRKLCLPIQDNILTPMQARSSTCQNPDKFNQNEFSMKYWKLIGKGSDLPIFKMWPGQAYITITILVNGPSLKTWYY